MTQNYEKIEKEQGLDPRVESLAIPLARDYAEKIIQNVKMVRLNQHGAGQMAKKICEESLPKMWRRS